MARRGRGVDFELRFRTSRWAEDLLIKALQQARFVVARIGLSQISRDGTVPDALPDVKVPDLLVFNRATLSSSDRDRLGRADLTRLSAAELAPTATLGRVVRKARAAIEVEFSPYRAAEMSGRHWEPQPRARLELRKRVAVAPKIPVAPNIWIKDEDLEPLLAWQRRFHVPITVVHIFDQEAFSIPLGAVERFREDLTGDPRADSIHQQASGIFTKLQNYDRQDAQAAGEQKPVFVITPAVSTKVSDVRKVRVKTQLGLSASRKYVAHVLFSGGELDLSDEFVNLFRIDQRP